MTCNRLTVRSVIEIAWSAGSVLMQGQTYQRAKQGEVISAGPMHSPQVNAIIFFNELDKFHTFNFANQLARANAGLVTTAVNEGEEEKVEPKILFPYLLACFENRDYPGVFHHRFRFLELWQASQQDLKVFSRRQLDRYDAFARSLDRQLAEALPDIGDSSLSSTREMQDALKEDEDMDDAANGVINNEGRRYANAVKEGRLRMEDVMENQSTSFGGVWEDEDDGSQVQWADIAPAKQYADWVDMCLDMCELQLKIARTKRDHKHLLRVHHKMERLIMDEDVRKLCTKYGFAGYGQ